MDYCPLRCTLDKVLLRLTATPPPRSFPEAFCLSLLLPEENAHTTSVKKRFCLDAIYVSVGWFDKPEKAYTHN